MIIDATGWEHEPTPWASRAACAGTPTELWFPTRGSNIDTARAVCDTCPVQTECLDYALRWDITFGIWGGLNEKERRGRVRPDAVRRIPAAHGTTTRYARGCRCTGCRRANYEYKESRVAGHVQAAGLIWLAFLLVFIVVGLRLLGMAL